MDTGYLLVFTSNMAELLTGTRCTCVDQENQSSLIGRLLFLEECKSSRAQTKFDITTLPLHSLFVTYTSDLKVEIFKKTLDSKYIPCKLI